MEIEYISPSSLIYLAVGSWTFDKSTGYGTMQAELAGLILA